MATFDAHKNLALSAIVSAPSPVLTGTSITITTGTAANFPAAPYNCTIWPAGVNPSLANAEIVRVTSAVGDVLTITRAQEGTTAKPIQVGYQIANTISVKVITDIENAVNSLPATAIMSVSGGTTVATGPQIVFSNSPTLTFGINGNTITASAAGGGGGGGGAAISAGTQSQNTGTVIFSNSNWVSFGLNNGTLTGSVLTAWSIQLSAGTAALFSSAFVFSNSNNVSFGLNGATITASASNASSQGSINFSAGTTSNNLSALTFSNANGVSFGLNASTITASVAAQSTQPVAASAANGSFAFSTLSFSNANGVSFSTSAGSAIVASHNGITSQTVQPVAASASNGSFLFSTLGFSNANGVTFGTSAGSIVTASVAAAGGAQTAISGIQVSNTTYTSGTVTFQNANGISFGSSGANGISASYTVPTVTNSSWSVSDSATSGTVGRLAFTNLNGVTLSLSTGAGGSHTIVGSHNGLTSQSNQNITAANGGFAFQTLSFSNANNISFSTSAGSAIIASATVASTQGSIVLSAGVASNSGSNFVFSNSNNITFGLNGSTITASATVASTQGSVVFGAVGSTNTGSQMIFSNSNNVSFGVNGSTITATATVSQSNQQITMFGTGNTTGSSSGTTNASSVIFRGSGAVTVAITNGSIVFDAPSAAAGNVTFSAGANSAGLGSIVFSNSNRVSFGLNGSTITAQHALNFSAGGASTDIPDQIVFSNANGVSFGLAGSTITASAGAAGAAGATLSMWENIPLQAGTNNTTYSQNFIYFDRMQLPVNLTFSAINMLVSVNVLGVTSAAAASGTMGHTLQFMAYTRSVTNPAATNFSLSNNLVSMFSNQVTFSGGNSATSSSITLNLGWQTNSTGGSVSVSVASTGQFQNPIYTGLKLIPIWHATSMTPGEYWLAFRQSSSTAGTAGMASSMMRFSHIGVSIMTNGSWGSGFGQSNSNSVLPIPGVGIYSVSSAAFPASLAFSDLSNQSLNRRYYVFNA